MLEGVIIVLQRGDRFLVGQRAEHKPAAGYWTQVSGKVISQGADVRTASSSRVKASKMNHMNMVGESALFEAFEFIGAGAFTQRPPFCCFGGPWNRLRRDGKIRAQGRQ